MGLRLHNDPRWCRRPQRLRGGRRASQARLRARPRRHRQQAARCAPPPASGRSPDWIKVKNPDALGGDARDGFVIMARHHYVPRFLLKRWATNGQFVSYYFEGRPGKVIENTKASVASACQIRDLNILFGVHASQRDLPETGFFTPHVDTPAAAALEVMLARGIRALASEQRMHWARLIVSFAVRTPEALRELGPKETERAFDLVEATAKGPPEDKRKVTAIIQANMQTFKRNFPLNAAKDLSTDPEKLAAVDSMAWWIRRWPRPAT